MEGLEQQLRDKLLLAPVLHVDETGVRVEAKRRWVHVASNDTFTYLYVDNSRGKAAIKTAMASLFDYKGTLIHDCFCNIFYFPWPFEGKHFKTTSILAKTE